MWLWQHPPISKHLDNSREMPTCRSWKTGLEHWKWKLYKVRLLVSNSIYVKKWQKRPSRANQATSRDKPRCSHAVCILRMHPPSSPYPAFSAEAEPISKRHWQKWHHGAESCMTDISAMGPKELRYRAKQQATIKSMWLLKLDCIHTKI